MLSLLQPNTLPPKGFAYTQPETGMTFDGNTLLPRQIKNVLSHRIANKLPRATKQEVYDDILGEVCSRYPALCGDILAPPAPPNPAVILPKRQNTKVVASKKAKPPPPIEFVAPMVVPKAEMKVVRKVRKCGACGGRKK